MAIGTWASTSVFQVLAYVQELFLQLLDACGLYGLYLVMGGVSISIAAILGPMVVEGLSGSDRASRRDDDG